MCYLINETVAHSKILHFICEPSSYSKLIHAVRLRVKVVQVGMLLALMLGEVMILMEKSLL